MHAPAPAASALVLAALFACSPSVPQPDRSEATWVLGSPRLIIGADDELKGHALHRVAGAVPAADGGLVIADGASGELRFFDARGRLVRVAGGRGGGPLEFNGLGGIWLGPGDTIVAWDMLGGRISYWSGSGEHDRTARLPLDDLPIVAGVLSDGALLAVTRPPGLTLSPVGHVRVDSVDVLRIDADAGTSERHGRVYWQRMYTLEGSTGGRLQTALYFEGRGLIAAACDGYYHSDGAGPFIDRMPPGSEVARIVDQQQPRRALSSGMLETFVADRIDRRPAAERPAARRYWDERSQLYPDSVPVRDLMLVDALQHLWVRRWVAPGDSTATWAIYSPSGERVATLIAPAAMRPLWIGADEVISLVAGEYEAEVVHVNPLPRTGSRIVGRSDDLSRPC